MPGPTDNLILPFHLASGVFRGRLARAGRVVADTVGPHDYPPVVAQMVGEVVLLGLVLASGLKYEGVFTLQARGDGPIHALVADVTSAGMVRGVARFREEALPKGPVTRPVPELLGRGHLAFTVDQGPNTERYQGIVSLEGDHLSDCVQRYFEQSEQLPTLVKVAAMPPPQGSPADASWGATAMVLQRMPPEVGGKDGEDWDEHWNTATLLMDSLTAEELVNPALTPEDLLRRPFHQEEVRVSPYRPVFFGCRCSRAKVIRTLATFPREEVLELSKDGSVEVTCEFCKATYALTVEELDGQTNGPSGSDKTET
ncbi:MAG: Hsp33 family molecular chaperone HslO [Rhodospirillum sp.]|nr:Hsp33 family molecular chaperone HslO [Rhodospirillum sp.]MCF8488766.1 Hsp33 family molecular chaperone HslO [Rhodospirillum sp.]MCF8499718.1 Hsp33 family molecular chaperone HslO [Rhodospirillum sp.]